VCAADIQTQDDVRIPVGPDGWPIDLESATTSPGEESQVSLCFRVCVMIADEIGAFLVYFRQERSYFHGGKPI
jgi:hypothetical protein